MFLTLDQILQGGTLADHFLAVHVYSRILGIWAHARNYTGFSPFRLVLTCIRLQVGTSPVRRQGTGEYESIGRHLSEPVARKGKRDQW